jgi:hypothetical protein
MTLVSLLPVRKGSWVLKASVLDDQIMVLFHNTDSLAYFLKMFYNEEDAYVFIEGLTNDSSY